MIVMMGISRAVPRTRQQDLSCKVYADCPKKNLIFVNSQYAVGDHQNGREEDQVTLLFGRLSGRISLRALPCAFGIIEQ